MSRSWVITSFLCRVWSCLLNDMPGFAGHVTLGVSLRGPVYVTKSRHLPISSAFGLAIFGLGPAVRSSGPHTQVDGGETKTVLRVE